MSSDQKKTLRLVQFNVENLFVYLDHFKGQNLKTVSESEWQSCTSSITPNKPIRKIWALAEIIKSLKPDVLTLNEVGGIESLKNFNQHFLEDAYELQLIEGNSRRGIDIGYMVRRDLGFKQLLITHKNRPIDFLYPHENQTSSGGKSHYFSRDVSELRLFIPGQNSPEFVILLVHLKSKLDSERIDSAGRLRRAAELKKLVDIYNEVKLEVPSHTGIIVAGDFNGIASRINTEDEFRSLYEHTDLTDVFEIAQIDEKSRFTQVQINHSGQQQLIQIDYIFVSSNLKDRVIKEATHAFHFRNVQNSQLPIPRNLEERAMLASDHYPIVTEISLAQLK